MNQVFNIQRLLQLFRKQWGDNRRFYLLGMLIVMGILAIIYFFNIFMSWDLNHTLDPEGLRLVLYFGGLYAGGCILASVTFSELSSRPRAIPQLLLPASNLEKVLTAWFFSTVLFFFCYHVLFAALDYTGIATAREIAGTAAYKKHNVRPFIDPGVLNIFDGSATHKYSLLVYFALQSFFLLGSLYFEKFSFIKTASVLLVIIFLFILYVYNITRWFLPQGHIMDNFSRFTAQEMDAAPRTVSIPGIIRFLLENALYAFAPVAWAASYFRLKEKEV